MLDEPFIPITDRIAASLQGGTNEDIAGTLFMSTIEVPLSRKAFLDYIAEQAILNTKFATALVAIAGGERAQIMLATREIVDHLKKTNSLLTNLFATLTEQAGQEGEKR